MSILGDKGASLVGAAFGLLVFGFLFVGVFWFMPGGQDDQKSSQVAEATTASENNSAGAPKDAAEQNPDNSNIKTKPTYTSAVVGSKTVGVTHPVGWEVTVVEKGVEGASQDSLTFKTAAGNYLQLFTIGSSGGSCSANDDGYRITRRIFTDTNGVFFMEYHDLKNNQKIFVLEDIDSQDRKSEITSVNETAFNTCDIPRRSYASQVYASLSATADFNSASSLNYRDISSDKELIATLKTLSITAK